MPQKIRVNDQKRSLPAASTDRSQNDAAEQPAASHALQGSYLGALTCIPTRVSSFWRLLCRARMSCLCVATSFRYSWLQPCWPEVATCGVAGSDACQASFDSLKGTQTGP